MKLEIGCGDNPVPGYIHLDIRPAPHVEFVCDFSKDKLPFLDEEVDEILMNHSIEHISYRALPHFLREANRVLVYGGKIDIRTPDLKFICKSYLAKETTPEHPPDEAMIRSISGELSPGWWANLKLFSGQDYPSNFHHFCLDFEMARSLLIRYGFEHVSKVGGRVLSPGELHIEALKA